MGTLMERNCFEHTEKFDNDLIITLVTYEE